MKKILVTGYSGMLGTEIYNKLNKKFKIYATSSKNIKRKNLFKFDFKKNNFEKLKKWVNPDIIIHCAAETNIDFCEKNKKNCEKINFNSIKKIVKYYPRSKLIFISSDSVYSGKKPHSENSKKKPLNFYGILKLKSENYIKKFCKNYFILRTTPVGFVGINNKKTFTSWIVDNIKDRISLNLFTDVFFSPISVNHLTREIEYIIKNDLKGIFNVSSSDSISKYEYAKKLCDRLNLDTSLLKKIKITNIKLYAKRNNIQVLNCSRYQKKFSRSLPSVSLTIKDLSNNY